MIVCDNKIAARFHRKLQYQVVLWVFQARAPQKINLPPLPHLTKIIDDVANILRLEHTTLPITGILIFKDQRDRQAEFEPSLSKQRQQSEGCTLIRAQSGNNNIGIEHNPETHFGIVFDTES